MAQRIQLSRRAGWRKPEGAVVVSRPSKWGNPFTVGSPAVTDRERAVQFFANWLSNSVNAEGRYAHGGTDYFGAEAALRPTHEEIIKQLRGRDLACWCPLDQPCHADVLLRIANGGDL
jgi:hypothetical protein